MCNRACHVFKSGISNYIEATLYQNNFYMDFIHNCSYLLNLISNLICIIQNCLFGMQYRSKITHTILSDSFSKIRTSKKKIPFKSFSIFLSRRYFLVEFITHHVKSNDWPQSREPLSSGRAISILS